MNIESVNIEENSLGKIYALKYTKEYKSQKYKYKLQQQLLIIDYLRSIRMSEDEIVKILKSETLFSVYLNSIDQIYDNVSLRKR